MDDLPRFCTGWDLENLKGFQRPEFGLSYSLLIYYGPDNFYFLYLVQGANSC